MKLLLTTLCYLIPFFCFSQSTIIWKGGTPGAPNAWENPRNWISDRVPNIDDKVIVYYRNNGHHAMPVIHSSTTIAGLEIYNKATVTISQDAKLKIDGEFTYTKGIVFYGGRLIIDGQIECSNLDELKPYVAHNTLYGKL